MAVRVPPAERIDPADVMPTLLTALADDPLWRWIYPDEETYERAFPEVMLLAARTGFDLGTVDVAEGGKAVAVWDPPGSDVDPNVVETMWIAHFQTYCDPARLDDVFAWSEQFGRYHPTEPHWYLGGFGVTPDRQGRGHGSALLRVGLERCDRDGLPAYLEASNSRNRPLYERHGFEVIGEIQAADSPSVWPMLRPPIDERLRVSGDQRGPPGPTTSSGDQARGHVVALVDDLAGSTRRSPVTGRSQPIEGGPERPPGRPQRSPSLLATTAIAVVWGGILVIAQVEQLLAPELRWWGHAFVHLWTAAWTTVIAVTATRVLRSDRAVGGALRPVMLTACLLAATAAVTNLLEIVGAYPAIRAFHDAVNRVGAPVGWLLLANLILIVLFGRHKRAASR